MLNEHVEKYFRETQKIQPGGEGCIPSKRDCLLARQDAQARAGMYRFLAAVYLRPPTPDLIRRLTVGGFLEELAALFGEETVADLKEFASGAHAGGNCDFLDQEYMNLFAVPTGRYVTPFEDVYRGMTVPGMQRRGPLMGERTIAVRRIYREGGADMDRACKELPTHIGVELSFMSFLCERQAATIDDEEGRNPPQEEQKTAKVSDCYHKLQIRFLREHLNGWFPQLNQSIQANARSPFYRGMARITAAFLDYDTAGLSLG